MTLPLKLTGTNYYPTLGFTNVSFVNNFDGNTIYLNITSINPTTIVGTLNITRDATPGAYDVAVTTVDGGTATKESAFTINFIPLPTISNINRTFGYKNTTVTFLINGKDFQT